MNGKDKILPIDVGREIGPRVEAKPKPPFFVMLMVILPIFSGGFVFWAMLNLPLEVSAGDIVKAVMVGTVAGLVSFAINKFGIDWATELAASGMLLVGVFGAASILIVGACLWFFSFGGINLPDVRSLRLAEHHSKLTLYFEDRYASASQATRIVPVIRSTSDDLARLAACEKSEGCVSGSGGVGTISRLLEGKARRAGDIAGQLDEGAALLTEGASTINEKLAAYQSVLSDGAISFSRQRQELKKLDAEIGRSISLMMEAVPVSLLLAYANELNAPVTIAGNPKSSKSITAILRKHGSALTSVIGSIEDNPALRPRFPDEAGLGDTLAYLGNFAGIAAVIFIAECVFPFTLFIYTLAFLIRQREQTNNPVTPNSTPGKRAAGRPPKTQKHALNGGLHAE